MTRFEPTDEQELAIDLFATGRDLVVNAGAGTGKTSTLELLAGATRRRGRYLAFNRSIVDGAKKRMPGNVKASTVHSLAFAACGRPMQHRLNGSRISRTQEARQLGIEAFKVTVGDSAKVLQPGWLAGHVMRAVTTFCQSADDDPGPQHFAYMDGLDRRDEAGRRTYANNVELAEYLLPALKGAWADLCDPNGKLRYSHDAYLKTFALEGRPVGADFLLHDEAQDANPVTLQILDAQEGCQVVHVGDSQQAIYGWRGAVDAMELACAAGAECCWLSQSFRFGPAIAEVANRLLAALGAEIALTGTGAVDSRVAPVEAPDAVLCRTNAAAVVELMAHRKAGRRPHLIGGGQEIIDFAQAAARLQAGSETSHRELACFASWAEVQAYVADDPQGEELRMMVALVDEHGPQVVMDVLDGIPQEDAADVVVSTAHKAKGRQWPTVAICDDFNPADERDMDPEDVRLLYVAVTRARDALDITGITPALGKAEALG